MWTQIQASQYFFLMVRDDYGYELYITDYLNIWTSWLSTQTFLDHLKISNDGLELGNDAQFVNKGLFLLENVDTLKKFNLEINETDQSMAFTMGVSFGYPFYFRYTLYKGSNDLFFKMVTQPLLKTISDLRSSESELRYLLKKKDSEILEYKCEGGELVLRHLKTEVFNDVEHKKKHKVYEENYGDANLPTSLVDKIVEVPPQKTVIMKKENPGPALKTKSEIEPNAKTKTVINIKTEPGLNIKTGPIITKTENNTDVSDEPSTSVITASVSCKQEDVKSESKSTQRNGIPRKRSKFNF